MNRINQPTFYLHRKKKGRCGVGEAIGKKRSVFLWCFRLSSLASTAPDFFSFSSLYLLLYSLSHLVYLRFALSICSWNQLTVNLFPGISTSLGDLPIDWPFNPVVKILPILTDMKQFQFGCFKVLARVIRNVKFIYPLCRAQTLPGNRFARWRWPLGLGTFAKSTLPRPELSPHSAHNNWEYTI